MTHRPILVLLLLALAAPLGVPSSAQACLMSPPMVTEPRFHVSTEPAGSPSPAARAASHGAALALGALLVIPLRRRRKPAA